jgi:hypothetical protein
MSNEHATTLYMRWTFVINRWIPCNSTDRGAVRFDRVAPKSKYFNVTMDVFDGQQYGMYTLCIEATNETEANAKALQGAVDDGFQKAKLLFTRPG